MADSNTTWSLITAYALRGWSVVPLHHVGATGVCSCMAGAACLNPGKHPLYRNWQRLQLDQDALAHVLRHRPEMNIGIRTGKASGVWALDEDPHNGASLSYLEHLLGEPLPATWSQRTGSGGRHWLFRLPPDFTPTNSAGRLPQGFDVRGEGGQIVVAPSRTNKGDYVLLDNSTPPPPPVALLDLVRPAAYTPREKNSSVKINMAEQGAEATRARAYALTALQRESADLATESNSRNTRAYAAACRIHELINAGWIEYDEGEGAYLTAAAAASLNKLQPFSEREALTVWANAAHKVGDQAAELPPSALGGERLDFPLGTMAPPSYSINAAGSSQLEDLMAQGVRLAPDAAPTPPRRLTLPVDFWEARPVLKHIRDAAHAQIVGADVALFTVLARLAAMWPHKVRLDTGVKTPASANMFVAAAGPSGLGKSSGVGVAKRLLDVPHWIRSDPDSFADLRPLGTGEGMAEVYMGTSKRPKTDSQGIPEQDRTGAIKTESYRTQVRHNAFMYADEGEALARMLERSGATIGETIRRAWSGETIGQSNGRVETTRIIQEGTYSIGLLIGFQEETAQPLLADEATGTPQRFLWCWVVDGDIPDDPGSSPGPLTGVWPPKPAAPPDGFTPWLIDPEGSNDVDLRPVTFTATIRAELRTEALQRQRGEISLARLDAHRPLMLVKVAALLAQLDGRREVSDDDWALAKIVWQTSCNVRDHLLAYGQALAGKARAAQRHVRTEDATDAESARLTVLDGHHERNVERVAVQVARKAQARREALTRSQAVQLAAGRDRKLYAEDAIARAVERGWLDATESGFAPGAIRL